MITLSYLAIDDSSLQVAALHLPIERIALKHLATHALRVAADHEIVVLHRGTSKIELKNTYAEREAKGSIS